MSQRPPSSSCQVYGSKVTMKLPACENIELQKHPWVRGCVNRAFSAGPTRALRYWLTDNKWHFVSRESERGDREGREKRKEEDREGRKRLEVLRPLHPGALYSGLKCLITWPVWPLASTQLRLSSCSSPGSTQSHILKGHHSPLLCSCTPKVIGKSNVSDLHFPSLFRRAKLLRSLDNAKGRGWPFWLLTHTQLLWDDM